MFGCLQRISSNILGNWQTSNLFWNLLGLDLFRSTSDKFPINHEDLVCFSHDFRNSDLYYQMTIVISPDIVRDNLVKKNDKNIWWKAGILPNLDKFPQNVHVYMTVEIDWKRNTKKRKTNLEALHVQMMLAPQSWFMVSIKVLSNILYSRNRDFDLPDFYNSQRRIVSLYATKQGLEQVILEIQIARWILPAETDRERRIIASDNYNQGVFTSKEQITSGNNSQYCSGIAEETLEKSYCVDIYVQGLFKLKKASEAPRGSTTVSLVNLSLLSIWKSSWYLGKVLRNFKEVGEVFCAQSNALSCLLIHSFVKLKHSFVNLKLIINDLGASNTHWFLGTCGSDAILIITCIFKLSHIPYHTSYHYIPLIQLLYFIIMKLLLYFTIIYFNISDKLIVTTWVISVMVILLQDQSHGEWLSVETLRHNCSNISLHVDSLICLINQMKND
ncbi:hypothetical protein VP01_3148g1 [Puccinia sorghi]|uniref:Uncharacterized protein n=1 Tax=Puccinia sorghi TaxID=27349 RepID=A0A0L6UYX6_9BASI|nr:hypothetical protein VP01_3148g1 [Puccinia sorghi]